MEHAMRLRTSLATAVFSAALAWGGLSAAGGHHGDVSDHSTTKGKTLAQIERQERQITADLNRKQLMPQVAAITPAPQTPALQTPMLEPQPEPPATPEPQPI